MVCACSGFNPEVESGGKGGDRSVLTWDHMCACVWMEKEDLWTSCMLTRQSLFRLGFAIYLFGGSLFDTAKKYFTANILFFKKINLLKLTGSEVKVTQSCPALWDPMDYTVHGTLQARILEWVAVPYSRESSQPRDRTQVSHTAGRFFTSWATRKLQEYWNG